MAISAAGALVWAGVGAETAAVIAPIAVGAVVGAGVSAGGALLTGGKPLKAAGYGALAGAAMGGIGELFGSAGGGLFGGTGSGAGGSASATGGLSADQIASEIPGGAPADAGTIGGEYGGSGTVSQAMIDSQMPGTTSVPGGSVGAAGAAGAKGTPSTLRSLLGLAGVAGNAIGALNPRTTQLPGPSSTAATQGPLFNAPLGSGYINRTATPNYQPTNNDWYKYGETGGQPQFFSGNQVSFAPAPGSTTPAASTTPQTAAQNQYPEVARLFGINPATGGPLVPIPGAAASSAPIPIPGNQPIMGMRRGGSVNGEIPKMATGGVFDRMSHTAIPSFLRNNQKWMDYTAPVIGATRSIIDKPFAGSTALDVMTGGISGLLGFGRNNATPLQDIQNALARGLPVSDASWAQAGLPPGGGTAFWGQPAASNYVNRTPTSNYQPANNDWNTYGEAGNQPQFFSGNQLNLARGGALRQGGARGRGPTAQGHVQGDGDGTSDSVPAMLSKDEYVFTAADVSRIGNGSTNAGVKKLDAMRAHLATDVGARKIPRKAKSPLQYMRKAASRR